MSAQRIGLLAYPMHGQTKLSREGYRTRDGHFIEWFGRKLVEEGSVGVVSRPEPVILGGPRPRGRIAQNTVDFGHSTWSLPNPIDRRAWWMKSARHYARVPAGPEVPAVVWNPFVSLAKMGSNPFNGARTVILDLLDDWTTHFAFHTIRAEVEAAYKSAFARATHVTANAEGTLELAHRYGRKDALLVLNGCDPQRFSSVQRARGPFTVGYVGKIGRRVDLELVARAAELLPDIQFVFAGPILDAEYAPILRGHRNIKMLGDVHYERVPALLETFDLGWVPHRVGIGEVGGDVIKTYEYRAAGLPVLTTPIAGAGIRGLDAITTLPAEQHVDEIARLSATGRAARIVTRIPDEVTWEHKSKQMLSLAFPGAA